MDNVPILIKKNKRFTDKQLPWDVKNFIQIDFYENSRTMITPLIGVRSQLASGGTGIKSSKNKDERRSPPARLQPCPLSLHTVLYTLDCWVCSAEAGSSGEITFIAVLCWVYRRCRVGVTF